jgi:hypothetical protein
MSNERHVIIVLLRRNWRWLAYTKTSGSPFLSFLFFLSFLSFLSFPSA